MSESKTSMKRKTPDTVDGEENKAKKVKVDTKEATVGNKRKADTNEETPAAKKNKLAPDAIERKVLRQIEFYFSDSNLPYDKFLTAKVQENPDGWVEIKLLSTFKRVRSITSDLDVIVGALRKSDGVLEVSEDGTKVKRATTVSQVARRLVHERSLYAKPFPDDTTIESVTEFFTAHGTVRSVRLRRDKERKFKGSVFVEMGDEKEMKATIAKELKVGEEKLTLLSKQEYFDRKAAESKAKAAEAREVKQAQEAKLAEEAKEKRKNCLVKLSGVPTDLQWGQVKEQLRGLGYACMYIDEDDLKNGNLIVRFKEGSDAKAIAAKIVENKTEFAGTVPSSVTAMEGEEEDKYLEALISKSNPGQKRGNFRRNNRRGGRGGRRRRN